MLCIDHPSMFLTQTDAGTTISTDYLHCSIRTCLESHDYTSYGLTKMCNSCFTANPCRTVYRILSKMNHLHLRAQRPIIYLYSTGLNMILCAFALCSAIRQVLCWKELRVYITVINYYNNTYYILHCATTQVTVKAASQCV